MSAAQSGGIVRRSARWLNEPSSERRWIVGFLWVVCVLNGLAFIWTVVSGA